MVEFLSVLIGLYTGVHTVELAAADEVAAIEVRLDGESLRVLSQPPWRFECDFGANPTPHELVAIAQDARGREIDRATRWVNVAVSRSAASMSLEAGAGGTPTAVRISWESIGTRRPRTVEVLFDGEPLPVTDPHRVPLPRFDPDKIHFISATLTFSEEQVSRLEASFGGALGEEIRTALTAVAVVLDKGAVMPAAEQMQGWFHENGSPLAVHGVERGAAEVIFVRDPSAQPQLERLVDLALGPSPLPDRLRGLAWLGKDVSLSFLAPGAAPLPGDDLRAEMFPHSPTYGADEGGLLRISQLAAEMGFPMYLGDAVAIAGMSAHGRHRRRAVVVLLGGASSDHSEFPAEAVRGYLRQLHVPLAVWSFSSEAAYPGLAETRYVGPQPADRKVPKRFSEALDDLKQVLQQQRIVWLEGRHLPQDIELSAAARGIRLAGQP
jgi:hypothetical protein